jgi:uncharacterized DUF497 family protein
VFEWDPPKTQANADKHGVTFDEAVTVFLDSDALDGPDVPHSSAEPGSGGSACQLMTHPHGGYTIRRSADAETIGLINARRASRRERAAYRAKN